MAEKSLNGGEGRGRGGSGQEKAERANFKGTNFHALSPPPLPLPPLSSLHLLVVFSFLLRRLGRRRVVSAFLVLPCPLGEKF